MKILRSLLLVAISFVLVQLPAVAEGSGRFCLLPNRWIATKSTDVGQRRCSWFTTNPYFDASKALASGGFRSNCGSGLWIKRPRSICSGHRIDLNVPNILLYDEKSCSQCQLVSGVRIQAKGKSIDTPTWLKLSKHRMSRAGFSEKTFAKQRLVCSVKYDEHDDVLIDLIESSTKDEVDQCAFNLIRRGLPLNAATPDVRRRGIIVKLNYPAIDIELAPST